MSAAVEVRVPDIGDFKDVPVIEVLVKPGQTIAKETPLVVLESEKASMEVPSPAAGTIEDVSVRVGDTVSQGSVILTVRDGGAADAHAAAPAVASATVDLVVPDIGDFKDVPVVEVLVKPGQTVAKETPLLVLESEKASMEVPSAAAGTIVDVKLKPGDKVSQGSAIATLAASGPGVPSTPSPAAPASGPRESTPQSVSQSPQPSPAPARSDGVVHASPGIRRFARELGVELDEVAGTGPHGRITREDVQRFVKSALHGGGAAGAPAFAGLPAWPAVDFAQYGPVERAPLSRIKKFSGPNLHRNWLQIPHITNYERADVTELEAFRKTVNAERSKDGVKLTMLAFLVGASVAALRRFPEFNASLDGDELVLKRYYNVGFAADTPNGLVVPVIRDAGEKGLLEIARESAELAAKARDGKLSLSEMQGGTFTISSIGGIGGTAFTQIVNAPEVAILGAVRASVEPVWDENAFVPRTMLPISLSYDHRVIDGASAARFLVYFAGLLGDFRRVLL